MTSPRKDQYRDSTGSRHTSHIEFVLSDDEGEADSPFDVGLLFDGFDEDPEDE
jgi:hypothetical protein|tara:strand:- start:327 stop:485 length:159 start_codon:yes stop_codon:yes gene_type:complete